MVRRRRRSSSAAGWLFMCGIAGLIALSPLVRALHGHLIFLIGATVLVVLAVVGALVWRMMHLRGRVERKQDHLRAVVPFHHMNDKQFEHALASLCRSSGCRDVRVSGGPGDRGADVTPDGRRVILQAKRYHINHRVGDREMQQLAGGLLTWHDFEIALLVTTSSFTKPARETAARNNIRLVDNKALAVWNSGPDHAPWDDRRTQPSSRPSMFVRLTSSRRRPPLAHR
ncbi:restriction system protein [Nocardia sp. GAS34]|uniref:restriction endonuclease n=1 Tax=unclassified Nocardia TaxID=2637762 RepID=UPI003D230B98